MKINPSTPMPHEDFIVSLLRSKVTQLLKVLNHIEDGNSLNGFVNENLRNVEKDLRSLREFYSEN